MSELSRTKMWKSILRNMKESSALKEETIKKETELSKNDPNIKDLLETLYLEEDRESSFQRFCASQEFKFLFNEIARHVGYDWNAKICEIGAGPGFLAVALAQSGFKNVNILEPNNEWITGTGFISNTSYKNGVHVWNSLDGWYESDELYDLIITKACVHHFDNISKVAAEIRCKITGNGKWLMFDEYFANSAEDLYTALVDHAHVIKYGQYEWPYSASLYVELMQLVGYKLIEVLPNRYENNYISRNISGNVKLTKIVTLISKILIKMKLTVFAFKIEKIICSFLNTDKRYRLFTVPQLLVFKLNKIVYPSVRQD
jgi:2-polyprenyl-3-methyl-5-hydroxy-6-metoxy-1,4-benzoquinol methylase